MAEAMIKTQFVGSVRTQQLLLHVADMSRGDKTCGRAIHVGIFYSFVISLHMLGMSLCCGLRITRDMLTLGFRLYGSDNRVLNMVCIERC